jgi:integrase
MFHSVVASQSTRQMAGWLAGEGKVAMRITDDRQARDAEAGLYGITGATGAWLEVRPNLARYPFWRGSLNGERITVALAGDSVAGWRKQAKLLKAKRDHGEDPRSSTAAPKTSTKLTAVRSPSTASPLDVPFDEAARAFAANASRGWKRGEREQRAFLASIETYALPVIGQKRIRDIAVDNVLAILRNAEDRTRKDQARQHDGRETAKRLRVKIRQVIASAIARSGETIINPADADRVHASDSAMKPKRRAVHYRRIERKDAPKAFQHVAALFEATGDSTRGAFLFIALNAARPTEARELPWSEIDFERRRWRLPPARSKTGKTHVTMLSRQSMAILARMKAERLSDVLVFPGPSPDKPIPTASFAYFLSQPKLGVDIGCPHSWRSQWRDWCSEAGGIAREVAEEQLQHTLDDVEGAYRRGTLIEPRKMALQRWADWLTGEQTVGTSPAAVTTPLRDMRTVLTRAIVRELERRHGVVSRLFIEMTLEDMTLDGVTLGNFDATVQSIADQLMRAA